MLTVSSLHKQRPSFRWIAKAFKVPSLSLTRKLQLSAAKREPLTSFLWTGTTHRPLPRIMGQGACSLRVPDTAFGLSLAEPVSPRYDLRSNLPQRAKSCSSAPCRIPMMSKRSTHAQERLRSCSFPQAESDVGRKIPTGQSHARFQRAYTLPLLCNFFLQTIFSTACGSRLSGRSLLIFICKTPPVIV